MDIIKASGGNMVSFSTPSGKAAARWAGDKLPLIGKIYDVEIDFRESLSRGKNAVESGRDGFLIAKKGNHVSLNGYVDSVDDDGLVYFRLGDDCLIMIDARKGEFAPGEWLELSCFAEDLQLTAFGS